jgi:glycosyltransferase involved in cell wall biosynthesis
LQNFNKKIFEDSVRPVVIPDHVKVVFVADLFAEDYVGGAELTTQALIDECPLSYMKIRSKDLNIPLLAQGTDKFWIFGNFAQMNPELIPSIVANLSYSILEYDYKYCRFRSPEKHAQKTGSSCDCHTQFNGKLVSAFYYGSRGIWWMSEAQKEVYHNMFPFLSEKDNVVLSSVFSKNTLGTIKMLRQHVNSSQEPRTKWIVLGSDSWVKGAQAAQKWCIDNQKDHNVVWGISYDEMLATLAAAEGFVYLPAGADTCPRMVIEAKLLGCKLHMNDNVQHKNEAWFDTDDVDSIFDYLYSAPNTFWNGIKKMMDYKPTISGYTTVYNADSQKYPFVESIKSMLEFCSEVCVVDGGSSDGTWEKLQDLASIDERVKLKQVVRDWNNPRFAVFDGMQKAEARSMCTSEYCWQMDCDEIVHEDDTTKIVDLCKKFPAGLDVVSLPVVEYWGGPGKVRADILPWKWRLSRNKPNITHGIPIEARRTDNDGNTYAAFGDGCDMIDKLSGQPLPHVSFYTKEADDVRRLAVAGDPTAIEQYEGWFNNVVENLPGVFHYSWFDIERKINLYKNYWTKHWESLAGKSYEDSADSNMMFDVPWSQVTDDMIKERAKELATNLGGWIWHKKWDGKTKTHHVKIKKSQPKIMTKGEKS